MDSDDQTNTNSKSNTKRTKESRKKPQTTGGAQGSQSQSGKLRGLQKDSPELRLSKTVSWLLRHGAKSEKLPIRADGYVRVADLIENPRVKSQALELEKLQEIVKTDSKQRFDLVLEGLDSGTGEWWIRANQGHSIKAVKLELKPVLAPSDIPSGIAVHGTTRTAWEAISKKGLSKMKRNHVHLAQGVLGDGVISGMRGNSEILIFIDVQKALDSGIQFFLSDNGVVLTEGNKRGFLTPELFERVEDTKGGLVSGWEKVQ